MTSCNSLHILDFCAELAMRLLRPIVAVSGATVLVLVSPRLHQLPEFLQDPESGVQIQPLRSDRPGPKPGVVVVTGEQRCALERIVDSRRVTQGEALRARIILTLAADPCVRAAAKLLGCTDKTVALWRERFADSGIDGLNPHKSPGRPPRIDPVSKCQLVALACDRPGDHGVKFRPAWTVDALCAAYHASFPDLEKMSRTSVLRVLNQADFRPHRMRVWLHSPDQDFRRKVNEICDLYLAPPPGAIVLCVDEKTGMQALSRKFPTKLAAPGQQGREEFEYRRHGTVTLIAAFNPHTGEVFGLVSRQRRQADLNAFMEALAVQFPNKIIHIVWDNLNTHLDAKCQRWTAFSKRHDGRFHFHHTPIHASWTNQVEIFFGVLHKRVLRHQSYTFTAKLTTAVEGFLNHWNLNERHPFRWTFSGYKENISVAA